MFEPIETKRLILRPLIPEDKPALVSVFNNLNVTRNLSSLPFPYTEDDAEELYKRLSTRPPEKGREFAIALLEEASRLIGTISFGKDEDGSASIAYAIGEPYWGKGLMTEAVEVLVKLVFQDPDIDRIETRVFKENKASQHILEKQGFEIKGESELFSKARGEEVEQFEVILFKKDWEHGNKN